MKNLNFISKALVTIATTLSIGFPALAYDFYVNGIYYDITSSSAKTVEVTYQGEPFEAYDNDYTGSATIPSSVYYNGITYSVTKIGNHAFYWCDGLTKVTIPNSVIEIGNGAFAECDGLTSITIPNSITTIGYDAFKSCDGLTEVTIGNSVTQIGVHAFWSCEGLTSVNITDLSAWFKIDFEDYFANPLYYANKLLLNGAEITNLVIPNDITQIKQDAFHNYSGLTSIFIGNYVTSIGSSAFYGCNGLTSVTIGNSVSSIGSSAFSGCSELSTIVSLNPTPPTCASSITNNNSKATLYVPKDSYAKYFIDDIWGEFSNIKKIETTATSITLDKSEITLDKAKTETIYATITPSNASISILSWASDNPQVATVNQAGKITTINAGTATITARAIDGSDVSASCKVTVNGTRIVLSQTEANLPINEILTLTYSVSNSTTNKTATWSTSDKNIAAIRVNSDNTVFVAGIADGVATITATANDGSGASASCVVTVGVGGIEGVEADDNAIEVVRYDIYGRLLSEPTKGVNIVKMRDGTTRKVIVNN